MADELTLTIDGTGVKAQPGTMIIQAAMDAGMYIPYLCYYPGMKPYGACRMCVVEVEGGGGTPASCTTPVADGMTVRTNTPRLVDLRKGIMELVISEHPHGCLTCHRVDLCGPSDICLRHVSVNDRCVTCPKNERCELKDTVRSLEMDLDTPLTYNNRNLPLQVNDPFWEMDMNLCIVCVRCVRVCDEIRGRRCPHTASEVRPDPDRHLPRHLIARVWVRVLWSVYRRMSHRCAGGARLQMGEGSQDYHQYLSSLPRGLPDDPRNQQT